MEKEQYRKGALIELSITDLAEKNQCFGRLDNGMAVMVTGMLAVGDRVSAAIKKIRQRYIEATLVEVLIPSVDRVTPECGFFGVCGGCKMMHIAYEVQQELKRKKIIDAMVHIGGFENPQVKPVMGAVAPLHYRNKIEFSFSARRYLMPGELLLEKPLSSPDFALGFHAPGNFEKVLDVDYCYLAPSGMNELLALTRSFCLERELSAYSTRSNTGFLRNLVIRSSEHRRQLMVNLVTSWYDSELMRSYAEVLAAAMPNQEMTILNNVTTRKNTVALGEEEFLVAGEGFITERLGKLDFNISANSFFQTNSAQTVLLYDEILRVAGLDIGDTVYDLFCGTGTIALYLSDYCRQVIGLEVSESSVADARKNAALNQREHVLFMQVDLNDHRAMVDALQRHDKPRVIVTDPPRAGMHPKALEVMVRMAPEKIVYVSCNPASLARDGSEICKGGYRLTSLQPVDMFPHTSHIESVACFERD
ncbi:MAG: 23S rRNA (uracil(1939)-C(5))-methyltransferase RlmD [Chlorobium phaeobacteroides]|jgi:23S rRNA (uracil1939-C5)-methyltransferase|nr:23S rRNA (uracil(1939)-C(5))-methyltransferase RlmD [Chlorobium phaeobacteroides]